MGSRCHWSELSVPNTVRNRSAGAPADDGRWHDTAVTTMGSGAPEGASATVAADADPKAPRISIVVNPAARGGAALDTAQRVVASLGLPSVRLCVPDGGPEASLRELADAAAHSDAVWVCGGDGMVHLAVNVLAGGAIPLGIIPAGTGNDSAAVLGMSADPVRAARQLLGRCGSDPSSGSISDTAMGLR